ncbi:MAG: glycosyltransferase [Planctomycetota bacterium]|nr:glycosyltransferase [Planctomycetota bacterium]
MDTPREVRHALHVFPSFVPAGSQTRTAAIINGLGPRWRHSVLSMDGKDSARTLVDADIRLDLVPAPKKAGLFTTLKSLQALLREHEPDLICTYNWGSIETILAVRSLAGFPLIHHEDGFGPDEKDGFKRRRTWARRYLLKRVPAVVVPSHNLGRIAKDLWRVPEGRLHVVPNGVDLARFARASAGQAPGDLRAELGIPHQAFVVGSVGHLRAEKNYPRLVHALATARELAPEQDQRLLLVGDGDERPALEALASELGLASHVHFAGHRADCAPAYRAMDLFCLSSDTEQMPISLVEAMASSLPAVSTEVGDVRLMMPKEAAGNVVPLASEPGTDQPDSAALGLARRFVALASDPTERARLGELGRTKAHAEYAFDQMLRFYEGLYEGLVFADEVAPSKSGA